MKTLGVLIILSLIMLTACTNQQVDTLTNIKPNTIEITSNGFTPKELTIKIGETITFINKDTKPHWPASAFHPTHTAYPGSNIEKCGTEEQENIFDACKELQQEGTYAFKFEAHGKWNYHDHLKPSMYGSIIVQ